MTYRHTPVLLKEVIEQLRPQSGQIYIDCTLGGAGYTLALAKQVGTTGRIISIDLDQQALDHAESLIKERGLGNITLVHDNFANLEQITQAQKITAVNGIVLDLGLSSAQLDDPQRGFSFQTNGPLDMAFGPSLIKTSDLINKAKASELQEIIKNYGEERYAKAITAKIIEARRIQPLTTTEQLVDIIAVAVPAVYRHNKKIHFATRTFQAFRIATNQELDNLKQVLPMAIKLLSTGGRLAVVSFHSLEDRIVKQYFKQEAKDCLCPPSAPTCRCGHQAQIKIINKKIITASEQEIKNNVRARSAKLRVIEKL